MLRVVVRRTSRCHSGATAQPCLRSAAFRAKPSAPHLTPLPQPLSLSSALIPFLFNPNHHVTFTLTTFYQKSRVAAASYFKHHGLNIHNFDDFFLPFPSVNYKYRCASVGALWFSQRVTRAPCQLCLHF